MFPPLLRLGRAVMAALTISMMLASHTLADRQYFIDFDNFRFSLTDSQDGMFGLYPDRSPSSALSSSNPQSYHAKTSVLVNVDTAPDSFFTIRPPLQHLCQVVRAHSATGQLLVLLETSSPDAELVIPFGAQTSIDCRLDYLGESICSPLSTSRGSSFFTIEVASEKPFSPDTISVRVDGRDFPLCQLDTTPSPVRKLQMVYLPQANSEIKACICSKANELPIANEYFRLCSVNNIQAEINNMHLQLTGHANSQQLAIYLLWKPELQQTVQSLLQHYRTLLDESIDSLSTTNARLHKWLKDEAQPVGPQVAAHESSQSIAKVREKQNAMLYLQAEVDSAVQTSYLNSTQIYPNDLEESFNSVWQIVSKQHEEAVADLATDDNQQLLVVNLRHGDVLLAFLKQQQRWLEIMEERLKISAPKQIINSMYR